jgi:hypothetical protein
MKQNHSPDTRRNLWDRTWKDRDGKVVMWQTPNAWLISWAGFTAVSLFFSGRVSDVFSWIASAALIIWSLLEIFSGVNYYRRVLGLAVLAYAVASLLKSV